MNYWERNPGDEIVRVSMVTMPYRTANALSDISQERRRQTEKWGRQLLPNGTTDDDYAKGLRDHFRAFVDSLPDPYSPRRLTWLDVLQEEFLEAAAETDPVKLREELIQIGAVVAAWVEAIDNNEIVPEVKGL